MKKVILIALAVMFLLPAAALAAEPLAVNLENEYQAYVGELFTLNLAAKGGTPPYTFDVSKLPSGLRFDTNKHTITGVPVSTTKTYVTILVTDAAKQEAEKKITLTIGERSEASMFWADTSQITISGSPGSVIRQAVNLGLTDENNTPIKLISLSFSDNEMDFSGGELIFKIPEGQTGTYSITVTASKDGYVNATRTIVINIVESVSTPPPASTPPPPAELDPEQIGNIVSGGQSHSLCLMQNGDVYAFGNNERGELGDGTNNTSLVRQKVKLPKNAVSVAAGYSHSLALMSDGNIYAWGANSDGRLGTGSHVNANTPVKIALPSGTGKWTAVDGGGAHSVALLSNGVVYAWGANLLGQLGDTTIVRKNVPTKVRFQVSMGKAVAVSAGYEHNLALMEDGAVYGWGKNYDGQLGIGTGGKYERPVKVKLPSGVKAVAISAGENHSLALMSNGTVYGFGRNKEGQLGNGADTIQEKLPTKVEFPDEAGRVAAIAAGGNHNLALMEDGSVYIWGWNKYGQIGYTEGKSQNKPILLRLPVGRGVAAAVSAGTDHSFVLMSDGHLFSLGRNESGQLGINSVKDIAFLTRVNLLSSHVVAMPK